MKELIRKHQRDIRESSSRKEKAGLKRASTRMARHEPLRWEEEYRENGALMERTKATASFSGSTDPRSCNIRVCAGNLTAIITLLDSRRIPWVICSPKATVDGYTDNGTYLGAATIGLSLPMSGSAAHRLIEEAREWGIPRFVRVCDCGETWFCPPNEDPAAAIEADGWTEQGCLDCGKETK